MGRLLGIGKEKGVKGEKGGEEGNAFLSIVAQQVNFHFSSFCPFSFFSPRFFFFSPHFLLFSLPFPLCFLFLFFPFMVCFYF